MHRVTAEALVALGVGGVVLIVEGSPGVYPVLTPAKRQAPVVEGHLVLDVEAGLLSFLSVVIHGEVLDFGEVLAVHRAIEVDGRNPSRAPQPAGIGIGTLVVQAQQQGVAHGAGLEVRLEVVVYGKLTDVFVDLAGRTAYVAIGVNSQFRTVWPKAAARSDALE